MSFEIAPFQPEFIADASLLLASRHMQDRAVLSELPARFEDTAVAASAIEAIWKREYASGFAAFQDGRLIAYLIGDLDLSPVWGRSGWVRSAGCAVAPGENLEIIGDLYALLGQGWLDYGCFAHFAVLPMANSELLRRWFLLSFGVEQVHALLDLQTFTPRLHPFPDGITVRRSTTEDREAVKNFSDVIWRHQTGAPTWGISLPETIQSTRDGWGELVDDPTVMLWLAFKEGELVGAQGYWPSEPTPNTAMILDERTLYMSVAGTRSDLRGQGIARSLTQYCLSEVQAMGHPMIETNWRSTNLAAARIWAKQGFRPISYRLVRRIDPTIAWANGKAW